MSAHLEELEFVCPQKWMAALFVDWIDEHCALPERMARVRASRAAARRHGPASRAAGSI
jgi:hypothetical protein